MNALLVCNDSANASSIGSWLRREELRERVCAPDAVDQALVSDQYSLIVVDFAGQNASHRVSLLQHIRDGRTDAPVMILDQSVDLETKILAFEAGADEYLSRPLEPREFGARVRAMLRRRRLQEQHTLRYQDLELDRLARRATHEGRSVELTKSEYIVLYLLMSRLGQVITRTEFLEQVWGLERAPQSNAIEVHICELRRSLRRIGASGFVQTVYRKGYRLGVPGVSDN